MSIRTIRKTARLLTALGIAVTIGPLSTMGPSVHAAAPAKPAISEEANAALAQMARSLLAEQFSFRARTFRVYTASNGQPLHIAHAMKVTVRRPDRMMIDLTGDDGSTKLYYDGKTIVIFGVESKKYVTMPAPPTLQAMLDANVGKGKLDFPLADFLTNAPDKTFLTGITSGSQVTTVTIDGVPCRHFLFTQSPGVEIELWVEKNERALPRRLVATWRSEPGQPSFIAEMSDWDLSIHPSDADFTFQPPEGAVKSEAPIPTPAPAQKGARP